VIWFGKVIGTLSVEMIHRRGREGNKSLSFWWWNVFK